MRRFVAAFLAAIVACIGHSASAVNIHMVYQNMTVNQQSVLNQAANEWEAVLNSVAPDDWDITVVVRWATSTKTAPDVDAETAICWGVHPSKKDLPALAWASNEAVDDFGRPIAAKIEFNTYYASEWYVDLQDPVPEGQYDFLSVARHELGHAVGFSMYLTRFARNVTPAGNDNFVYNDGGSPTMDLFDPKVAGGFSHADGDAHPDAIMQYAIGTETRRTITSEEFAILNHDVWVDGANEHRIELTVRDPLVGLFEDIRLKAKVRNGNNGYSSGETVQFVASDVDGHFEGTGSMATTGTTDSVGEAYVSYIPTASCSGQAQFTASVATDPPQEDSGYANVVGCADGAILASGMMQDPEIAKPGDGFTITGIASYSDGLPMDGGTVEVSFGDQVSTVPFIGSVFTSAALNTPATSQIITVKLYSPDECCVEAFDFTLVVDEANSLTIKHPLPGDRWAIGSTQEIRWEFESAACGVDIELSHDGGSNWSALGTAPTGERRKEFTVPGPATTNAYVRVTCQSDPSVTGIVGPIEIYALPSTIPYAHTVNGSISNDDVDQGMDFSPDGNYIAFRTSTSTRVTIYDARTYQQVATPFPSVGCFAVGFSPNSRYVASVSNEKLYVWDLQAGSWFNNGSSTNNREGEALTWITNSRLAIIGDTGGGEDGGAVYDIDGTLVASFSGLSDMQSLASDGIYIYGGNDDGLLAKWSQSGGSPQTTRDLCMNDIFALAVSPTNTKLVAVGRGLSACDRPNVSLVNIPSVSLVRQGWVFDNTAYIQDACYDPNDASRLAIVERDGQVAVFNEMLQITVPMAGFGSGLTAHDVSWSPNGVVAVNAQNRIRLYPFDDITDPVVAFGAYAGDYVVGCASDPTGVLSATYQIDGGDWFPLDITPDGCFSIDVSALVPGSHEIVVGAVDMPGNHGVESADIAIPCDPIAVPQPMQPANGVTGLYLPVTVSWESTVGAVEYEVQLTPDGGATETVTSATPLMLRSDLQEGTQYTWRVRAVDACGESGSWSAEWTFETEQVSDVPDDPTEFALYPCAPNPFNPSTVIRFDAPRETVVRLRVYDLMGRLMRTLVDNELVGPGNHEAVWNGKNGAGNAVAAGIYLCRIEAGSYAMTRRMTLLK